MRDDAIETLMMVTGIIMILFIAIPLTASYLESETFNRLCGGKTTLYDAMFVELRVDGTCTGGASKNE